MIVLKQYRDKWLGEKFDSVIGFYPREFYCLDNFSSFGVKYNGDFYPTVEHAYQSLGFIDTAPEIYDLIKQALSAHEAQELAFKYKNLRRKDWDTYKVELMENLLRFKIRQNPYVEKKLLETEAYKIVEDSPKDDFWGWGENRDGKNMLGCLWMKLRNELMLGVKSDVNNDKLSSDFDISKIKKYIDCDGVILDTETGLFDEYHNLKKFNPNIKRLQYLQQLDWQEWIRQAKIINNAIDILKEHHPSEMDILTKVHSLNEGLAKIQYFRELGIKNNVILVPNDVAKSSVVTAQNHLLVDDSIKVLDDWSSHNGIPLFFNQNGINDCTFNEKITTNTQYPLLTTLEDIFSKESEEYCKRKILRK